jgi:ABC-type molybdate transport system substrate-binding protein
MPGRIALVLAATLMATTPALAAETVQLYAAGSLRAALDEAAKSFAAASGIQVKARYGASGLLKDEIEAGAPAEIFASANMDHPRALSRAGKSGSVVLFARNRLCALARPELAVDAATLLERLMEPGIKLGTSTPKADPSGDYAWEVFRKAEKLKPGSFTLLDAKALKLTGGPGSVPAPAGRSLYGLLVAEGKADIFLTYCTNALVAQREYPGQQIVQLPETLAVGADYGLTVLFSASPAAYRFGMFILAEGQRILANHGFSAPALPQDGAQP